MFIAGNDFRDPRAPSIKRVSDFRAVTVAVINRGNGRLLVVEHFRHGKPADASCSHVRGGGSAQIMDLEIGNFARLAQPSMGFVKAAQMAAVA